MRTPGWREKFCGMAAGAGRPQSFSKSAQSMLRWAASASSAILRCQVRNLSGGFQSQVAALNGSLGQRRQVAHHRQAGLFFQHGAQHFVQAFLTVVEQNSCDMMRCAKRHQSPQLGRQRQAGPFRPHDEQGRQIQRIRQVPRAGRVGHTAQAVIVAHGPLDDRRAVVRRVPGVEFPHRFRF